ncbi:MAG: hypothetical protein ACI4V5_01385 [Prevotella sp.]
MDRMIARGLSITAILTAKDVTQMMQSAIIPMIAKERFQMLPARLQMSLEAARWHIC